MVADDDRDPLLCTVVGVSYTAIPGDVPLYLPGDRVHLINCPDEGIVIGSMYLPGTNPPAWEYQMWWVLTPEDDTWYAEHELMKEMRCD